MAVQIKEVLTRQDLWKWVRFPNQLYKDNPYFVPFLESDEFATFSRNKNPAYAFCDTKLFLAYQDGKIAGRIAGLINRAYNEKWEKTSLRFTRFDFIDDFEVSQALFDAVVAWGKEHSLTDVMGPIGFTDLDHEGMLVEGFDRLNMSITFYNHPYYLTHMERLGLQKDIDWIEFRITIPEEPIPKFEHLAQRILEKGNYEVVTYADRKALRKEAFEVFRLVDVAYSKLYGTVPLTEAIIQKTIDDYIPVVNLDYLCSIKDKTGKIVGFGVLIPSVAKALKKTNGKMFPLGFIPFMQALQGPNDTLEMFLVAVDPALQRLGLPVLIIDTLLKKLIQNKVRYCESGPTLETNAAVHSLFRHFEKEQHKRRRCFRKEI